MERFKSLEKWWLAVLAGTADGDITDGEEMKLI